MEAKNIETIVLDLATGDRKINLPELDTLRNKRILGIIAPSISEVSAEPDNGTAQMGSTQYLKTFLTLDINGAQAINRVPLKAANPFSLDGKPLNIGGQIVNFAKSFIEFAGTIQSADNGKVLILHFIYE